VRVGEGVENTPSPDVLLMRGIAIASLPWLFDVAAFCTESNDLGRWRHTMVVTALAQRAEAFYFECQAVVANATAAGCCALACQRTQRSTGRRRTASHKALADGTLAQFTGEQAAVGQTARLRLCDATRGLVQCFSDIDLETLRS
jgi:hypothetical protein